MTALRLVTVLSVILGTAACAAPPRAPGAGPEVPRAWSVSAGRRLDATAAPDARWWETLGDPVLTDLVRRATAGNPGLAAAAARVREARALAGVADAGRWPEIDARGGASSERRSDETGDAAFAPRRRDLFHGGFDASWEIDLFGRASDAARAAAYDAAAAEEDRRAALVSLRAEVVRAYVSLRGSQRLVDVLEASVRTARGTEQLTRSRATAGLAASLDVARAAAQRAAVEAAVPPARETVDREVHRLAILCGEPPEALRPALTVPGAVPVAPPRVLLGTPAETLARRPDLVRDARRVAAEEARTGVARADLYPRVSLGAAFGVEADDAGDAAKSSARTWTLSPSVRWPLFDGGRARDEVVAADARLDAARARHRETLLAALGEVEDALSAYLRGWDRREALAASVASRRDAVALAADTHRAGLVTFLDVLDAQRSLFDTEADLVRAETETSTRLVAIHKALGGGEE